MDLLIDLEKAYIDVLNNLIDITKHVIDKTENDIGHPMKQDEKNLCCGLVVLYAFMMALEKK